MFIILTMSFYQLQDVLIVCTTDYVVHDVPFIYHSMFVLELTNRQVVQDCGLVFKRSRPPYIYDAHTLKKYETK